MGERKIPLGTGAFMIAVAVVLDCMNIALDFVSFGLLGWMIDFLALGIFSIWLSTYNASLWSSNPGLTLIATIIDAVPFGDLAFPWTWRIAYSVFNERESV